MDKYREKNGKVWKLSKNVVTNMEKYREKHGHVWKRSKNAGKSLEAHGNVVKQ